MGRKPKQHEGECSVEGCKEAAHCRGVCKACYHKLRRRGEMQRLAEVPSPLLAWITRVVSVEEPEKCIEWPFSVSERGYGQVAFMGRTRPAHRVALMLSTGMYGLGLQAAHVPVVCHNRRCCNPAHLRWATAGDNEADKDRDGTKMLGENHYCAKLSEDQVLRIMQDSREPGLIANEFGVSDWTIRDIKKRKKWRHLQPAATA